MCGWIVAEVVGEACGHEAWSGDGKRSELRLAEACGSLLRRMQGLGVGKACCRGWWLTLVSADVAAKTSRNELQRIRLPSPDYYELISDFDYRGQNLSRIGRPHTTVSK